jgi:PKD repeat protein
MLTGPSEFALSVGVTATPDTLTEDGSSQSTIAVTTRDANGKGMAGVSIHLDMLLGSQLQDFGNLSARTITTGADGRATAVYTAPGAPPPATAGSGTVMTIRAIPTDSNFQTAIPQTVAIRLVPPGVILPPAGTPTASFTVSPTGPAANTPVVFDASASTPGANAQISSFAWAFGDGGSGTGQTITHVFTAPGTFNVTLTITNTAGLAGSITNPVVVSAGVGPTADFAFSPSSPVAQQTVVFDASLAKPGAGHTIASYSWIFGDGATGSGQTTSHAYTVAGTFNVTLTVTDEAGQKASVSKGVPVAAGAPALVAAFSFSPTNPTISKSTSTVFFDATPSSPGVVTWTWDFGDGSAGFVQKPSHTYTKDATYVVRLTVTDSSGRTATTTSTVTVAP